MESFVSPIASADASGEFSVGGEVVEAILEGPEEEIRVGVVVGVGCHEGFEKVFARSEAFRVEREIHRHKGMHFVLGEFVVFGCPYLPVLA